MNCPFCSQEMVIENVRVHKTTDPERDDTFEKMWWCYGCGHAELFIADEKDEYDPDAEI